MTRGGFVRTAGAGLAAAGIGLGGIARAAGPVGGGRGAVVSISSPSYPNPIWIATQYDWVDPEDGQQKPLTVAMLLMDVTNAGLERLIQEHVEITLPNDLGVFQNIWTGYDIRVCQGENIPTLIWKGIDWQIVVGTFLQIQPLYMAFMAFKSGDILPEYLVAMGNQRFRQAVQTVRTPTVAYHGSGMLEGVPEGSKIRYNGSLTGNVGMMPMPGIGYVFYLENITHIRFDLR